VAAPNCTMSGSGQVLGFLPIRFFGGNPHVVFAISVVVCPAGEAKSPLLLANAEAQPGRERLRHLVIGSPDGVRGAINHLHLLRYAEQREWSRLVTIPESGILITPEQGEVFSYCCGIGSWVDLKGIGCLA
jgi:hypothetical protein